MHCVCNVYVKYIYFTLFVVFETVQRFLKITFWYWRHVIEFWNPIVSVTTYGKGEKIPLLPLKTIKETVFSVIEKNMPLWFIYSSLGKRSPFLIHANERKILTKYLPLCVKRINLLVLQIFFRSNQNVVTRVPPELHLCSIYAPLDYRMRFFFLFIHSVTVQVFFTCFSNTTLGTCPYSGSQKLGLLLN